MYLVSKCSPYLCAECQLVAQSGHIILQQVDQTLEEGIVFAFHVCIPMIHKKNPAYSIYILEIYTV